MGSDGSVGSVSYASRMKQGVPLVGSLVVVVLLLQLTGCAGLMMGGGGGYQPAGDECSESERRQGRCKSS